MDRTHYRNAPITEAIVDLRVDAREGLTLQDLKRVMQGEDPAYREAHNVMAAQGHVELGETVTAAASQRQIGYVFKSVDQKQVAQVRTDGFTFSRLAPYEHWEPFRDEARRLWSLYRERVAPTKVVRLAVRYVNRFDLFEKKVELKDYFRTGPEVSPDLTQPLGNFFMRLAMPQDDLQGQLLINQTLVQPPREGCISVVLDIDLFRETDVPCDDDAIWRLFDLFRNRKNQVFEACITDRLRELIH